MRNYFLLFLVFTLGIFACQNAEETRTRSGYKYEFHTDADGTIAKPGDFVSFQVATRNQDSVVFDSRNGKQIPQLQIQEPPTNDAQARQTTPLMEVLELMSVGDSVTLYYPIDTLPQKPRNFENAEFVIFDIVMTDIMDGAQFKAQQEEMRLKKEARRTALEAKQTEVQAREAEINNMVAQRAKDYAAGKLDSDIKTTPSGLKYIIHETGDGAPAQPGDEVSVHYYGALTDGKMFDNSFSRGMPFDFPLGAGRVIRAWDEGVALMREGTKATLFVPSELGYGAAGAPPQIPGGAELIFYIEVEEVL